MSKDDYSWSCCCFCCCCETTRRAGEQRGVGVVNSGMAFSSSLPSGGGRVSPPSRGNRQLTSAGVIPRDKVSRIVFLSILLVIYSGITLGLILWNSQSSASAGSNPTVPDDVVGQLRDDSLSKLDPQAPAEPGIGAGGGDAAGKWEDTGRRPPLPGKAADRGGGGTGEEVDATASPGFPPNGSNALRRAGRGTTQHNAQAGKDNALVLPGQVDSMVSGIMQRITPSLAL